MAKYPRSQLVYLRQDALKYVRLQQLSLLGFWRIGLLFLIHRVYRMKKQQRKSRFLKLLLMPIIILIAILGALLYGLGNTN